MRFRLLATLLLAVLATGAAHAQSAPKKPAIINPPPSAQDYAEKVNGDDAWGHLGRAQASLGRLDEARATFKKAARLFPSSALPMGTILRRMPESCRVSRPAIAAPIRPSPATPTCMRYSPAEAGQLE